MKADDLPIDVKCESTHPAAAPTTPVTTNQAANTRRLSSPIAQTTEGRTLLSDMVNYYIERLGVSLNAINLRPGDLFALAASYHAAPVVQC